MGTPSENGSERWEGLFNAAREKCRKNGAEVVAASRMVWNTADALAVVDQFASADPDLLVILHVNWVRDMVQYLFVNNLDCPVVLWAVPFPETFSLGCVQHFGSILLENGIRYRHACGLPDDRDVIALITSVAQSAKIARNLKKSRVGLIGPRQTWRVANAQDMTQEEWDFSRALGATIVHIEMDELIGAAEKQSSNDAEQVLHQMKQNNRLGQIETDQQRVLYAAKIYLGAKDIFTQYGLTAAAAQCWPKFGGMGNLPSSWLADEGVILDTEGDIAQTFLLTALTQMSRDVPASLCELGSVDKDNSVFYLSHEGSSAHSLAEDASDVHIQECAEGVLVGFPHRPMPEVTLTGLSGNKGRYRMLIATGSTEKISQEEWAQAGSILLIKVRTNGDAGDMFNQMLSAGIDHHLLVREGNITEQLKNICDILDIEKVCI